MHFIICVKNHVLWNRNTKTQMFMHKRKENKLLLIEHWKENKEARLTFIFLLLRKWHWNIDTEKAVLIFTPSCYVRSCQGIKLFSTRVTAAHSFPYPKTAAWEELTVVTLESGIFAKTPGIWTPGRGGAGQVDTWTLLVCRHCWRSDQWPWDVLLSDRMLRNCWKRRTHTGKSVEVGGMLATGYYPPTIISDPAIKQ